MGLLYRVIKRFNPQNRVAAPKYYAEIVVRGSISFEKFLDAVCEDTTLNRDKVRMAFNKGFRTIRNYTGMGFNVHLDSLGYTKATLRSKGENTPEEITANSVLDIMPHFVFGSEFRDELKKESLEKIKD
jgi:nucleoid DNA-binding protein